MKTKPLTIQIPKPDEDGYGRDECELKGNKNGYKYILMMCSRCPDQVKLLVVLGRREG